MLLSRLHRGWGVALLFVLTLTPAIPATAALIDNSLELPFITFRNVSTNATAYNASGDTFSFNSSGLRIKLNTVDSSIIINNGQLNLNINVDDTGTLVMNTTAQDLTVSGEVTIGGILYSGVLLHGKVNAFGFANSASTTDKFDFQLSVIGGELATFYPDGLGLSLISESSNFNGSFMVNFNGRAKGTLGSIDAPPLKAALGDFVWQDLNMNGTQDLNEPGIENVTVNLLSPGVDTVCNSNDDQFLDTTLTNVDGMYGFSELDAGDYCVEFIAPAGYVYSPQGVGSNTNDSNADPVTGKTTTISLAPGDNDLTWDAGLHLEVINASLGDFVWADINENGVQDTNEPGIENVIVNLYSQGIGITCDTSGSPDESTTTNTTGFYNFIDLTPGNYCVEFMLPVDFVFSPADQGGNDAKDSDANPLNGQTIVTTLDPGENDPNWDAGLYQPVLTASLGNFVWDDQNMDGIQGDINDEPGIEGVTVNLLSPGMDNDCNTGDEGFITTTMTDMNGIYGFNDIDPGEYCVEFIKPNGYVFSPVNTTTNDLDSDADLLNGHTAKITLNAGDNDLTWDAGVFKRPPATLGDRVWNDLNADGIQNCIDNGDGIIGGLGDVGAECDTGIAGVTVSLLLNPNGDASCNSGDETVSVTTLTDSNGFYEFTDLDPDLEYCVRFDQPSANQALGCDDIINPGIGAQFSSSNQGTEDAIDSDADTMSGQTGNISLNSGDFDRRWDAGVYCPAKIGDMLVDDRNRDGIQGDLIDEPGIDGQLVQLVKCEAGVPGTDIVDSKTTENGGMYMFNPLPPGEYAVIFSKPAGTEFSPSNQGNDDSRDCDTNPNGHSACMVLGSNEYNQSVDACVNVPPAGLGNFVFEDKNLDGIQDSGEPGIDGLTVNLLLPGADLTCNTNDDIVSGTTTTTGNGGYQFTGLNPGTYCVEFDIASLADNFCSTNGFALGSPNFTLKNQGMDDAADSDADPTTGKTGNIVLVANQFDPTHDAGIYCPAKIGDRVWEDTNSNGVQDITESGVPGLEVNLFECGPDGVAGTADDVDTGQSRITDNQDGSYMFGGEPGVYDLPPGEYFVQFTKPYDSMFTSLNTGNNSAIDSDCGAGGVSACTSLSSRDINLSRDCGLIPTPPPSCDLVIDKTCLIETPPTPSFDKCSGKLQEFTVTWTGGDINVSGLPNDAPNGDVTTGQDVTFYGPFDNNDVFVNITGAVTGQSKFHMSCSDEDFNAPDDCGKLAGNSKDNADGFINEWKLEGFVDADNTVLACSSDSAGDFPVEQSCSFIPELASCELLGKPTSLTFKYTGGGCSDSSNDQEGAGKAECSGDVNGLLGVNVVAGPDDLSETYAISSTMVAPGGEFTITADKFNSNSRINISNTGGTESNGFHTSCSVPLEVGDKFGSLELVGFNDVTAGTDVLYGYTVTNHGDPLNNVSIVDSKLGTIADMLAFDMGQTRQFTQLGSVSETTTSTATVSGLLANADQCQVSDELTVEVVVPVTPVSCGDIKDITELSMVWSGADGVNILAASGQQFNNVQNGNKITFSTVDLGNNVDLYLSGAVNGTSTFHVSCSDDNMDGTQHCGTLQGNNKDDDPDLINQWLLDGMTGEQGAFACGLNNTGVVEPEAGSSSGGGGSSVGNITGATSLDIDDDKIKWKLYNDGSQDVYITEVVVTWPTEHEQVKKFKIEGDFAKDVFDGGGSTSVPADKAFESDDNKRKLKAGDDKNLEIEFTEKYNNNSQDDYTIMVTFDDGTVLSFN